MRLVREYCQRGVIAHGVDGFGTGGTHRDNQPFHVFFGVAEDAQHAVVVLHAMGDFATAFQFVQLDAVAGQPSAVWFGFGKLFLQFAVIIYFAFLGVYKQYLARLQASFFLDVSRLEIHHADFAGHYHHAALRNQVACRAQSVPVEHAACIAPVTEKQCRRSVPRLHQDRVVFIESFQIFADGILFVERFRYEHGHGMRQAQAGHEEKLEHIVQRGTVAHARLHDGAYLPDVSQGGRGEYTLTGFHPAAVAADGIDFAVVCQQAERLCQSPGGESVGAETGVHQCQPAGEVAVGEVGEVVAQLQGREHPLVDDVLRRERDDVEILAGGDVRLAYSVLYPFPYYIEFAVGGFAFRKSGDENLLDVRFVGKSRFSQYFGASGHVAQMHQGQSILFNLFDNDAQDDSLVFSVFGKEKQAGAVFSFLGNGNALQQNEFVRYLQHDAGTVSGFVVRPFRSTVAHVFQYLQCRFYQFM